MIHEALKHLAVDIDSLTPDPRNARAHSERNLQSIVDSLREHGQRKPVVVQLPDRIVRAGNGTLEAAMRLGWTQIAAVMVEESDEEAVRFAIRDNRTAELAEWDLEVLSGLMQGLDSPIGLGFEDFELEPLLSAIDWAPPEKAAAQDDPEEKYLSLKFTAAQWDELESVLGPKPTATAVLEVLRG